MEGLIKRETLLACTRVRSDNIGGSGTVIYSAKNKDGKFSTYILTNQHVVANNIKHETKFSPLLQHDVKTDVRGTVEVHFFRYRWEQRAVGSTSVEADIMAYDPDEDLALLKLRSDDTVDSVAKLYPKGQESKLPIGIQTIAIGAGLGEPPVLTQGYLSQFGREIDNREYWLQTAPTIYGNSGGAVFLVDTQEFIGVPSRISVVLAGLGLDAITHLSFIVPITRVYKFLEDQMFRFIYDPKFTEEGEEKARDEKRKEEERKVAQKESKGEKGI